MDGSASQQPGSSCVSSCPELTNLYSELQQVCDMCMPVSLLSPQDLPSVLLLCVARTCLSG
jgi:hypothetical protein